MTVSKGLVRASQLMARLSLAAAVLTPLGTVLLFLFPDYVRAIGGDISITAHYGKLLMASVPLLWRMIALAFAIVPTAIAVWGLLALARLFRLFSAGDVFSPDALAALSRITAALFWNVIAAFITEAPITYCLSQADLPGHRFISLGIGSDDVQLLFLAGVAFVIARVMAEARRVADENAAFV
ncbi:MAG: DUF2975 domain-containing protein [Rhizomicrobium sp.]|jgi:hypothetical protein